MSLVLITVNAGIPSEKNEIVVADTALPYLYQWMRENGYERVTPSLRGAA